jgi:hypothetical protein
VRVARLLEAYPRVVRESQANTSRALGAFLSMADLDVAALLAEEKAADVCPSCGRPLADS